MADIIGDRVFDEGLGILTTDVEYMYICSAQPTTFAEASVTYMLGYKATPTITGPTDGTTGRSVNVSTFSDGVVDAAGNAAWFALCDNSNSELLISGNLGSTVGVATGSPWSLTTGIEVNIPDPTT